MLQPSTVRVFFFFDFYHHDLSQKLFLIYLLIYLLKEFLAKFGFILLRFDVISNITFNHLSMIYIQRGTNRPGKSRLVLEEFKKSPLKSLHLVLKTTTLGNSDVHLPTSG